MADETTRDRIRAAIEEWAEQWQHPHGTLLSALTEEEVADLVERALLRADEEGDDA